MSLDARSLADMRRRLAALDQAVDALRRTGIEPPESLILERFEVTREIGVLTTSSADSSREGTQVGRVFVIMPFRDPFNSYYASIIKPAVADAGFEVARSDEIFRPGAFIQTVWTQIVEADAVIAEMTGSSPNVLYELGLCHAINKKVIMVTQSLADVPADLRHFNCLTYDTTRVNWEGQLRSGIQKMLLFPNPKTRTSLLSPTASVDSALLFDQLERKALEALRQLEEEQGIVTNLNDRLGAALAERSQLRKSLDSRLNDTRKSQLVPIIKEGGVTIATMRLPGRAGGTLDFVRVPAGRFFFGGSGSASEMWLPTFWISRHSVSNGQYCAFLNAVGLREEFDVAWIDLEGNSPADHCQIRRDGTKYRVEPGFVDHPVTYVNFYGALAFCEWVGGGLPTAEQWEKAARGTDRRPYPWGSVPPSPQLANIGPNGWDRDVAPIDVHLKQAGSSPFGMIQAIGNVWHWTSSYFPDRNIQAVRGGSFFDYRVGRREVYRFYVQPDGPDFSQGFVVTRRFLSQED